MPNYFITTNKVNLGFLNYIKNKFLKPEPLEGRLLSSVDIYRSSLYIADFNLWLNSQKYKDMLKLINNSHKNKKDKTISILKIPSLYGLTYHYSSKEGDERDFLFLFDFFQNKLHELGYQSQNTTVEHWEHPQHNEKIQRCQFSSTQNDFGKILLQLIYINDELITFKCCACQPRCRLKSNRCKFQKLILQITNDSL